MLLSKTAVRHSTRAEVFRSRVNPAQRGFDPLDRLVDPTFVHPSRLISFGRLSKALPRPVDKSL